MKERLENVKQERDSLSKEMDELQVSVSTLKVNHSSHLSFVDNLFGAGQIEVLTEVKGTNFADKPRRDDEIFELCCKKLIAQFFHPEQSQKRLIEVGKSFFTSCNAHSHPLFCQYED